MPEGRKKAGRTSTRRCSNWTLFKRQIERWGIGCRVSTGHLSPDSKRRITYCRNFNQTIKSGHRNYSTVKTDGEGLGRSSDRRCFLDCLSGALTRPLGAAFVGDSVKLALFSQNKVNVFDFNLGALV